MPRKPKATARRLRIGQPAPPPLPTTYLGQVGVFGFPFAPAGWAACDGSMVQIRDNVALFELIRTTYGGNGVTYFNLPKLAPIGPEGPGYFIALQGTIPQQ